MGILDSIRSQTALARSDDPALFATSGITFAEPADVASACKRNHFENIGTRTGEVRFVLNKDGEVTVESPVSFSPVDY